MKNSMYSLNNPTIREIVDSRIELPRYQRRAAWNDEKRFKLCVSLFKGYPIGTLVVQKTKNSTYLLDGRQRLETIRDMQDPNNIYRWAKSYLKIGARDNNTVIREKFRDKIQEYLQYENNGEDVAETPLSEDTPPEQESEAEDSPADQAEVCETSVDFGLDELCKIICNASFSGSKNNFSDPFNFTNKANLRYRNADAKKKSEEIDNDRLLEFIKNILRKTSSEELTTNDIAQEFDNPDEALKKEIEDNIDRIKQSVKMCETIMGLFSDTHMSVITLDDSCRPSDSMKIFEIINTAGVKLTQPEIMNAKVTWNRKVENPCESLVLAVNDMYSQIGVKQSDVVRWDVAATLAERLCENAHLFIKDYHDVKYDDPDKITTGFKLMSGYYLKSITKDNLDKLSTTPEVDWTGLDLNEKIDDMCNALLTDMSFQILKSYKVPLENMLGRTVALCYLLVLLKDYEAEGVRASNMKSGPGRKFIAHARILLDKLIFEYVNKSWRGSSDHKLGSYLDLCDEEVFARVDDGRWDDLIDEIYSDSSINGDPAKSDALSTLTYYFTLLTVFKMNSWPQPVHIDHIIPRARSVSEKLDCFHNYGVLPAYLNEKKTDKELRNVASTVLKEICEWENIPLENSSEIGPESTLDRLKEIRSGLPELVKTNRRKFLGCEDQFSLD